MSVKKYRKKPVEIEAMQYDGRNTVEVAKRLREEAAGFAEVNPADNVIPALAAGADALDRLADPVTLGKLAWDAVHAHGAFSRDFPDETYYRAVGEAIARGETTNHEERRER